MQLYVLTAALFAGLGLAQDLSSINNLPPCGVCLFLINLHSSEHRTDNEQKTCINNMLSLAPSLGCQNNNITCLCTNMDFGNGVRDCSAQSCPSGTDTSSIVSVGNSFCSS